MCLESWNYLRAAQHYLLARHVYSQLGRGGGGVAGGGAGGSKQVSSGTVQKLWQSVAPFKETILEVGTMSVCLNVCLYVCLLILPVL